MKDLMPLVALIVAWAIVVRTVWNYAKHAGWNRGFEDGCAFVRRVAQAEKDLRNVEPLILTGAEHRLIDGSPARSGTRRSRHDSLRKENS